MSRPVLFLLALWACTPARAAPPEPLPRAEGAELRVLSWNVSRESFFMRGEGVRAVLRAAGADLLLLDEMPGREAADEASAMLAMLDGTPWKVVYGKGGGAHQRASIAARVPLLRIAAFDELRYAPEQIEAWVARMPERAEGLRRNLEGGVAAVGAIASFEGRRLLLVSADLQCCGDAPEAWEEQRRRVEAGLIRAAIEATVERERPDAVILGGDLNLVQGQGVLEQLAQGTPALRPVDARHADGDARWTWDGSGTPFPNGRLDFLLHDAALRPLQARVHDHGEFRGDTGTVHHPVIADFRFSD